MEFLTWYSILHMQLWILWLWPEPELLRSEHVHNWLQIQQVLKTRGFILLECWWEQIYPGWWDQVHSCPLLLQALMWPIPTKNQTSLPRMWPSYWNSIQAERFISLADSKWTNLAQLWESVHSMQVQYQDSGLAAFVVWRIASSSFHPLSQTEKTIIQRLCW